MKKYTKILIVFIITIAAQLLYGQANTWEPLGTGLLNGTNGNIYAVTSFNGKIIAGGQFTQAGGISVNNIAAYDTLTGSWSALGQGVNGEVHSLSVYAGTLVAGGQFTQAGGNNANNIARWNGIVWQSLGSGTDGEVEALIVFGGDLIAAGNFEYAGGFNTLNIARWNGSVWSAMGNGLSEGSGDMVGALTIYAGNLVAGGRFENSGATLISNVARWTGTNWQAFNSSQFDERVQALDVYNGELIVGGRFQQVGSLTAKYIIKWNGSTWQQLGGGLYDGDVEDLEVFKGKLIVAGNFRLTGTNLFVDRITLWDGANWHRMLTGMNNRVNTLYTHINGDTVLYAAGEFTSAGGKWCNHAAKWGNFTTSSVSGQVRYADNNELVQFGEVKIVRFDVSTREVIAVDSALVVNGTYNLQRVPKRDSLLRVIVFPDDELDSGTDTEYVPTYFPSAITWYNASVVDASENQTNIDVNVYRKSAVAQNNPVISNISGSVFLNIFPPATQGLTGFPYLKSSIVYIKQGPNYIAYAITNQNEQYSVTGLTAGTYEITVSRLGYETETRTIVLGPVNLDTVNFYLDTINVIGITNINTEVPKNFRLYQNYPNPFNPVTNIKFQITGKSFVNITLYDITGRETGELVNEELAAGTYKVDFNAGNLSSGVYFYRITVNDAQTPLRAGFSETKKMIILK